MYQEVLVIMGRIIQEHLGTPLSDDGNTPSS